VQADAEYASAHTSIIVNVNFMRVFLRIETPPKAKVSDGSQPTMTFDLSLSESAGSRSQDRFL